MKIKGIHHVSSITANAQENYHFYTQVLGMRLVKKSVNQDTPSMYHLFYADEIGRPGTDLTFFEIPLAGKTYVGINSISRTSLRVPTDHALVFWKNRLDEFGVKHDGVSSEAGRKVIRFRDPEGQRLTLISDETNRGVPGGKPWKYSPVSSEYGIVGLGPVTLTVADPHPTIDTLTNILTFQHIKNYPALTEGQKEVQVFSTGEGGTGAEVHVETRNDLPEERPGRGSVHHVAFRVENEVELIKWNNRLLKEHIPNSGIIDRFYFKALYFREPNGILFELSTDGPGFTVDEEIEHLGESLALPPQLENRRAEIEQTLQPLNTSQ